MNEIPEIIVRHFKMSELVPVFDFRNADDTFLVSPSMITDEFRKPLTIEIKEK